jgi:hypothetical protein
LLISNYYFHIFAINNVVYKHAFDKNNDQYFKFMCSVWLFSITTYNNDCVWHDTNGYSSTKIISKINDTVYGINELKCTLIMEI